VADHRLEDLKARRGFAAERVLRQEDAERCFPRAVDHTRRSVVERPVRARPELEPRPAAGLPDRVGELRALLDERLVDDDENVFAFFEAPGLDQVPAPALHRFGHDRNPRRPAAG
jgi:hypothetical protein